MDAVFEDLWQKAQPGDIALDFIDDPWLWSNIELMPCVPVNVSFGDTLTTPYNARIQPLAGPHHDRPFLERLTPHSQAVFENPSPIVTNREQPSMAESLHPAISNSHGAVTKPLSVLRSLVKKAGRGKRETGRTNRNKGAHQPKPATSGRTLENFPALAPKPAGVSAVRKVTASDRQIIQSTAKLQKQGRRRYNEPDRLETYAVRLQGGCIRCRSQRIRVSSLFTTQS